jgi:hypothetical protein
MKTLLFSIFVTLSAAAFAAESKKLEIPGYVIVASSDPRGEEWWMPSTKPLGLSRYALTNESLNHPLIITILHYTSAEIAKNAFALSSRSRPKGPEELKVIHWDAAHRWQTGYRSQTDMCLLKGNYVVGVYALPSDSSTERTGRLLEALADNISSAEPKGRANERQPSSSETNSTSAAAASRRSP